MKSFPFIYEVTLSWYDNEKRIGHILKVAGVGSCTNYTNAMKQIEDKYGDELASIERLESIGEYESTPQTVIPIKREWVQSFIKEDNFNWQEETHEE